MPVWYPATASIGRSPADTWQSDLTQPQPVDDGESAASCPRCELGRHPGPARPAQRAGPSSATGVRRGRTGPRTSSRPARRRVDGSGTAMLPAMARNPIACARTSACPGGSARRCRSSGRRTSDNAAKPSPASTSTPYARSTRMSPATASWSSAVVRNTLRNGRSSGLGCRSRAWSTSVTVWLSPFTTIGAGGQWR